MGEAFQTFIRRHPAGFALVIAGLFALVAWSVARDAAVAAAALAAGLMLGWINLQAGLEVEGALRAGFWRSLGAGLGWFAAMIAMLRPETQGQAAIWLGLAVPLGILTGWFGRDGAEIPAGHAAHAPIWATRGGRGLWIGLPFALGAVAIVGVAAWGLHAGAVPVAAAMGIAMAAVRAVSPVGAVRALAPAAIALITFGVVAGG